MIATATTAASPTETGIQRERYLQSYRFMLQARLLDDKFASLYRAAKIAGGVFLGRGQEAVSVALAMQLRPGDVYAPLIRDQAGRLAFGETPLEALRTYLGSPLGPMQARDGNVHRGRPRDGYLPMISHLGAMISAVNGMLIAHRFQGRHEVIGATCLGEGGTSTGAFHEGLNQAAVEKLPLILVVVNNQYAYSTPSSRQFACEALVDKAAGYGVKGHSFDGTDLTECLRVFGDAAARARQGGGPQLVVARLLRLCGHGEHDDAGYVDPALRRSPVGRDCLKVAEEHLLAAGWSTGEELSRWRSEAMAEIEDAAAKVQREAAPEPYAEVWCALASKHLAEGN